MALAHCKTPWIRTRPHVHTGSSPYHSKTVKTDAERLGCDVTHAHVLPSYCGICLRMNVLACPAMHLCVTLGKKARLHLMFLTDQSKTLPSLLDVCLEGVLGVNSHPSKHSAALEKTHPPSPFICLVFFFTNSNEIYTPSLNPAADNHWRCHHSEGRAGGILAV